MRFSLLDLDVKDKNVLVRVDENNYSSPTITYLKENGAKITILTNSTTKNLVKKAKLKVGMVESGVGQVHAISNMQDQQNNPVIAHSLAQEADFFVNDALSLSQRKLTTTDSITHFVPSLAGFEMEKMVHELATLMQKKVVWIVGPGPLQAKILDVALVHASKVLVNTTVGCSLLKGMGLNVGASTVDSSIIVNAKKYSKSNKIELPIDFVIRNKNTKTTRARNNIDWQEVCENIGEKTQKKYARALINATKVVIYGKINCSDKQLCTRLAHAKLVSIGQGARQSCKIIGAKASFHTDHEDIALHFLRGKKISSLEALEHNFKVFKKAL